MLTIQEYVNEARRAHVVARNFDAINHKALARRWRAYRADCMRNARCLKAGEERYARLVRQCRAASLQRSVA